MSTSKDRMHGYALRGVRDEIAELTEKVVQLKSDFPSVSAFDAARAALVESAKEVGRLAGVRDDDDDNNNDRAPSKPKPNGRPQKPKSKPKQGKRRTGGGLQTSVALQSWHLGRDVLRVLQDKPDGMNPTEVSQALAISYGAAYWRLKTRVRAGHCRLDEATTTFFITPAGKAALAKDDDAGDGGR